MSKLWWISAESFQNIEANDRHCMVQLMHPAKYESNKVIYSSAIPGDVIYFLKKGRVTLFQSTPAKTRRKLVTLTRGDIFGSINMIETGFKEGLAQTEAETHMLVLRKHNLEQLMKYFPGTGARLIEFFRLEQERLQQELNLSNERHTCRRLVRLLLHYLDNVSYQINQQSMPFLADVKELAVLLGSRPDVVRACLSKLENQGLLELRDQDIKLLNRQGLEQLLC